MPLLKGIYNGQKLFVMNLIINLDKKKFTKMETNCLKKIIYSNLWEYNTSCKSKVSISNTKGLERFAWIESGAIMKKAFKYWNAFLASTP
jgi:hypothetical protein